MKQLIPSALAAIALLIAPASVRATTAEDSKACSGDCAKACCTQPTLAADACPADACPADACPADCEKPCCADATAGLTKVTYQVNGLTCAACETKVTKALSSVNGVGKTAACSESKKVQVAFDAKQVKDKQLLAAIQKAGFKVQAETVEVKVDGMNCGACSGKVSQALTQVKGVQKQEVCHESGNAVVKFDPNKISRAKVLAAIDQTGFKVVQ